MKKHEWEDLGYRDEQQKTPEAKKTNSWWMCLIA